MDPSVSLGLFGLIYFEFGTVGFWIVYEFELTAYCKRALVLESLTFENSVDSDSFLAAEGNWFRPSKCSCCL